MDKSKLCRICADLSNNTNSLFDGSRRKLISKIKDITGLQLKNLKNFPRNICKLCQEQLLQAHKFRQRCIRAQEHLKTLCEQNDELSKSKNKHKFGEIPDIKQEAQPIEEVICNKTKHFKAEKEEDNPADSEMQLKQEPTNADDSSSSNESLNSLGDDSRDKDMLACIEPEISLVNNENPLPLNVDLKAGKNSKSNEKQKRVEQNFICDQCGQHFTVKPYFKMHMLRHSGIKPYPCKLCPKAYYASKGLKHHMLTHTGEKPFPCKYCERRFNSRSHLTLHTRGEHTNERPFVCDQCPKSFISNNNFKAHMVTHSVVRAFICKLCNVSYKRQNHLSRHYASVMHKENQKKQQSACSKNPDYSNIC